MSTKAYPPIIVNIKYQYTQFSFYLTVKFGNASIALKQPILEAKETASYHSFQKYTYMYVSPFK